MSQNLAFSTRQLSGFWFLVIPACCIAQETSYEDAKGVFPPGEQDRCQENPYKAKRGDKWLVLVEKEKGWELQVAKNDSGQLVSRSGSPVAFLKQVNPALTSGPVIGSRVAALNVRNGLVSEATFSFKGDDWRWIEWGYDSAILVQGDDTWVARDPFSGVWDPRVERPVIAPGVLAVPAGVLSSSEEYRDDYDPGKHVLVWAGDLDRDGTIDLITFAQITEAWGTMLWHGVTRHDGSIGFERIAIGWDACS